MSDDYRPGGKVTVDGVEYEIDEVGMSATLDNGVLHLTTHVRTRPKSEMIIEITITTPW